ncbi:MAG: MFS transporter [Actinomycetota bacterium]|nr:MFS transporter [Actinomycetota bacterium]
MTATRAEKLTIYAAGLVQGITLVTFPAASTIFTSPGSYHLTAGQYGLMFAPQVIAAIAASLAGSALSGRFGRKSVYLAGLTANLASMALLAASAAVAGRPAGYPLLLAATACLGLGFGLTVPAINTYTAAFHPGAVDRSVLVLNALLGLGTAAAPVFVAIFVGLGAWVGLPILAGLLLAGLAAISLRLPLRDDATATGQAAAGPGAQPPSATAPAASSGTAGARPAARIPVRFWPFALFAVGYGFVETMNGNWSQIDLTGLHVSATVASLTLTMFWAMVTAGRVLFAAIGRLVPTRVTYHLLPFALAGAFLLIAALPPDEPWAAVGYFGLAGLGCSALLPLTISLGQEKLTGFAASVASGVIACYQLGYGLAAFGVGPLRSAGLTLADLYALSAAVSVVLGLLSLAIARRRPSPVALHPRPASHLRAAGPAPARVAATSWQDPGPGRRA